MELWLHSRWHGGMMQLTDVDAWDLCPQGQFWPKCLWCGKFHLPYEGCNSHRESIQHRSFRRNFIQPILDEQPGSLRREALSTDLRQQTEEWAGMPGELAWTFL